MVARRGTGGSDERITNEDKGTGTETGWLGGRGRRRQGKD
jgi:hypothetical protein